MNVVKIQTKWYAYVKVRFRTRLYELESLGMCLKEWASPSITICTGIMGDSVYLWCCTRPDTFIENNLKLCKWHWIHIQLCCVVGGLVGEGNQTHLKCSSYLQHNANAMGNQEWASPSITKLHYQIPESLKSNLRLWQHLMIRHIHVI